MTNVTPPLRVARAASLDKGPYTPGGRHFTSVGAEEATLRGAAKMLLSLLQSHKAAVTEAEKRRALCAAGWVMCRGLTVSIFLPGLAATIRRTRLPVPHLTTAWCCRGTQSGRWPQKTRLRCAGPVCVQKLTADFFFASNTRRTTVCDSHCGLPWTIWRRTCARAWHLRLTARSR